MLARILTRSTPLLALVDLCVELAKVALEVDLVLRDEVLLQRHVRDVRFLLSCAGRLGGDTRIEGDACEVFQHMVWIVSLITTELVGVELVV